MKLIRGATNERGTAMPRKSIFADVRPLIWPSRMTNADQSRSIPRPSVQLGSAADAQLPVKTEIHLPAETKAPSRKAPPRVLKPSRANDQVCAPTPDLEGHRVALRRVFGTLSEDFSQTMFGKLVAALRPNPFEQLDEATLNAAIALIASMQPETELEAILAVQIAATGFAGRNSYAKASITSTRSISAYTAIMPSSSFGFSSK